MKDEGEDEEDNTARFNLSRRPGPSQSSDHAVTLQRVMSLTQRNRMVRVFHEYWIILACDPNLPPLSPHTGPQQALIYAP